MTEEERKDIRKRMLNGDETATFIDDDKERILCLLIMGRREPQNDYEREILKSINDIEKKGGVVDIPFN